MANLTELMSIPGAKAAFSMNDRGELIEHTVAEGSGLNETTLDLLAHMCVANMAIATMQARGWEASSNSSGFYPVSGFTLVGMDWSAVTSDGMGVVVANGEADYEKAHQVLAALGGAA